MILSALLASVAINVILCLFFFIVYTLLRNRRNNANLYVPRLLADGNLQSEDGSGGLKGFFSSLKWVKETWQLSEDELLSNSGLDAVVFMRIFVFGLRVFRFAGVIGIFILLPFNYLGNQLNADFTDLPNKSLETFSISNVDDKSNRLWIHFSAVYIFTAVVCYLLYFEFDYIASKRIACFYSSKPQPNQFTVLVRSIPTVSGKSLSENVEDFFSRYYPSTYLSHNMVRRTHKLKQLVTEGNDMYRKLTRAKTKKHSPQRFKRTGFLGLFGQRVDLVNHYEKRLEHIEDNVRTERSSLAGKEVPAAFVSFKSRFSAAIASNTQQGVKPTEWLTELAPGPHDVYWPFFSASFVKRWMCTIVVIFLCILITVLFLFPVIITQGLTHLDQLEAWLPFLTPILRLKFVSQIVIGYLPSLILQMFLSMVPPIMFVLSSIQGYIALSQIEKSACIKVLWFTIWNVFFANVLSGSVLYRVDVFLEPKRIPELLAIAVPGQASFFIAYVVTSGWTRTFSVELFRVKYFTWNFVKKGFCFCKSDEDVEVPSNPYHKEIPNIVFFILLGITYFFLAPLILPFILLYFCMGYIIYRNQLLNVYAPKFETGGKFWPVVHDATIFSLILMHVIAVGIFGVKKVPLASSLMIPLPILTIIFNSYCQRRFLPCFKGYPAECLINKDRLDRTDPRIPDFYQKLATAYQDPSTTPIKYSESSGSLQSLLLR